MREVERSRDQRRQRWSIESGTRCRLLARSAGRSGGWSGPKPKPRLTVATWIKPPKCSPQASTADPAQTGPGTRWCTAISATCRLEPERRPHFYCHEDKVAININRVQLEICSL